MWLLPVLMDGLGCRFGESFGGTCKGEMLVRALGNISWGC